MRWRTSFGTRARAAALAVVSRGLPDAARQRWTDQKLLYRNVHGQHDEHGLSCTRRRAPKYELTLWLIFLRSSLCAAQALEMLGMSLPYSASIPAIYPEKKQECLRSAKAMRNLLEKDLKPR